MHADAKIAEMSQRRFCAIGALRNAATQPSRTSLAAERRPRRCVTQRAIEHWIGLGLTIRPSRPMVRPSIRGRLSLQCRARVDEMCLTTEQKTSELVSSDVRDSCTLARHAERGPGSRCLHRVGRPCRSRSVRSTMHSVTRGRRRLFARKTERQSGQFLARSGAVPVVASGSCCRLDDPFVLFAAQNVCDAGAQRSIFPS